LALRDPVFGCVVAKSIAVTAWSGPLGLARCRPQPLKKPRTPIAPIKSASFFKFPGGFNPRPSTSFRAGQASGHGIGAPVLARRWWQSPISVQSFPRSQSELPRTITIPRSPRCVRIYARVPSASIVFDQLFNHLVPAPPFPAGDDAVNARRHPPTRYDQTNKCDDRPHLETAIFKEQSARLAPCPLACKLRAIFSTFKSERLRTPRRHGGRTLHRGHLPATASFINR